MKNKGFAITALLYGLSIMGLMTVVLMMSIMQNSRKNNSTLVRSIEQELNSYGSTAVDYTTNGNYTVPSDQTGFYKMELCGGPDTTTVSPPHNVLTTGTVYLKGGTILKIVIGDTSSVSVVNDGNVVLTNVGEIMKAGNNISINGMAKYTTNSNKKSHPFINGQVIEGTSCTRGFTMNKVSEDSPSANNGSVFNGLVKIITQKKANVTVVSYVGKDTVNSPTVVTSNNKTTHTFSEMNVSEIYINYTEDPTNTQVKVYKTGETDSQGTTISPNHSSYTFAKAGYTMSRFGTTSAKGIQTGNYAISRLTKSSSVYSINQRSVLSTSAYTPTATTSPAKTMCQVANDPDNNNLIHYGHNSLARPVKIPYYRSLNGQKWRFETITVNSNNYYKITEIEEYKPLEVHKDNDNSIELTGEVTGPILVCGEYVCEVNTSHPELEQFKSTDVWTGNMNQRWKLEATGLGTYRFKTNDGNYYLFYVGTQSGIAYNKFYLTKNESKADLFYLYNVNL